MLVDEVKAEALQPGRDRRMRGEDVARLGDIQGFLKGQVVLLHHLHDALQGEEGGVALVHMADQRPQAHRIQGAQPADAHQDFLADAGAAVAAVQPVGQVAVFLDVLRHVGIEQEELDAAHLHLPDLGTHLAVGHGHADLERLAVLAQDAAHGQVAEIVDRVGFLLEAVRAQVLLEIALLVEETNADQGHVQIAGTLEMIPAQDAQATRIVADALGQAELGGEVGDVRLVKVAKTLAIPRFLRGHVVLEVVPDTIQMGQKGVIFRGGLQLALLNGAEHPDGVVL